MTRSCNYDFRNFVHKVDVCSTDEGKLTGKEIVECVCHTDGCNGSAAQGNDWIVYVARTVVCSMVAAVIT